MAVLAMDIGGTNTRCAIQDSDGIQEATIPTLPANYSQWRADIAKTIRALQPLNLRAVCVAIAGAVQNNQLVGSGNLGAWIGQDIQRDITYITGCSETRLVNDGRAMAARQYVTNEGPSIAVIIGSGANMTIAAQEGVLSSWHGNGFYSGEAGHIPAGATSRTTCGCGRVGCFESLIGGTALEKRHGKPPAELDESIWQEWQHNVARWVATPLLLGMNFPLFFGGGVALGQQHRLPAIHQNVIEQVGSMASVSEFAIVTDGDSTGLKGALEIAKRMHPGIR